MTTTTPTTWRKSSYSANLANCVELATAFPAVRDSKNPNAGYVTLDQAELAALIDAASTSKLDSLV